jgi:hypothetical protein
VPTFYLRLELSIKVEEKMKVVKFKFDLHKDSPDQVAKEMVNNLKLPAETFKSIAGEIRKKINYKVAPKGNHFISNKFALTLK